MNVLCDRHHAGLLYSLQLLLEDRLGYKLYTPIGHEWWDAGIWRFGEVFGDDRLARQYLDPGEWLMFDPEFPERPIHGITLPLANVLPFEAVIATVQENQRGFHRFAREHGAKFVVQVGNTGQQIDWTLDPLVINNSEMPMLGPHVDVGQEFDSDGLYAFSEPTEMHRIGSFVNCMPQIVCWPLMQEMRSKLPKFSWAIHGIDGPDGNVKPAERQAEIMRGCGWGWHDKAHGDGFGHVLHYWAAIGRPLIGHASHYNGKRGSIFWRDLETCIDLDKHSEDEAAALIRTISLDRKRHLEMCKAIRAVLDANIDWAGDAEKVKGLLGG